MSGRRSDAEVTLGVTAFKPRSLDLIEQAATGKVSRVVLTKRGRAVAVLVPLRDQVDNLWGALADLMEPVEGADLAKPTGERWAAEDD